MKYSLLFLLVFIPALLFGQSKTATFYHPNYNPAPGNHMFVGPMINLSNTYNYNGQTVNAFVDSLTQASGTTYFNIADAGSGTTFAAWPIYNTGTMAVIINCTKISGTPDVVATLEESPDGVTWGPAKISYAPSTASTLTGTVVTTYTGNTPETFTMTNIAGAQKGTWNLPIHYTNFTRLAATTTTVTQSSSCKVKYQFNY